MLAFNLLQRHVVTPPIRRAFRRLASEGRSQVSIARAYGFAQASVSLALGGAKPQSCEYQIRLAQRRRDEILEKLGGRCAAPSCLVPGGARDPRCLQVDHVNDDGTKDDTRNDPRAMHRKVMADTEGRYQLLCANCNVTKEYERRKRDGRKALSEVCQ